MLLPFFYVAQRNTFDACKNNAEILWKTLCIILTYMYLFFTERDIIGLTESSQLVYFGAKADLDDNLVLSRALLNRSEAHSIIVTVCGCTQIRT